MSISVRNPKDLLAGLLFMVVGLGFMYVAREYGFGSARRMGPGYFPTVLGGLLATIGLLVALGSMFGERQAMGRYAWSSMAIIAVGIVAFGLTVRGAGLVPAIILTSLISSFASVKFRPVPALIQAVVVAAFSVGVFRYGLGLPMAPFGPWLGQ